MLSHLSVQGVNSRAPRINNQGQLHISARRAVGRGVRKHTKTGAAKWPIPRTFARAG